MVRNFHTLLAGMLLTSFALVTGNAAADVTFDATGANNCIPLNGCGAGVYQQVYSSTPFGSSPQEILGIKFKAAQDQYGHAFGPSMLNLTIDLSTTAISPATITNNPAVNLGTNDAIVFSGNAVLSSSGANMFDVHIPFTTPYLYNPAQGNLLVGINVASGSTGGQLDWGYSLLVGRAYEFVAGSGYRGEPYSGLATQFVTSPVPEPEIYAMMTAGLALFGFAGRCKKRRKSGA